MTVSILLVDDHPIYRAGVRLALESCEGLEVAGEAASGEDAVAWLCSPGQSADLVLMDIQLPGMLGTEAIRAILTGDGARHHRDTGTSPPRVLVVSMSSEDDVVVAALRAGAHGYVGKEASREELIRAVRTVAHGGGVFSPSIAVRLGAYFSSVHELPNRAAFPQLTDREREILGLLARGRSNRGIARELVLSEKTVRNHISHVFAKLQVKDRAAAVVRARDAGLGT
ncbi:response regulator [Streptomyces iconiensis]|uniref:Response regulator transcription factor n=1 Tax=Streptomyces iconiensis TaxID=1384038 RepID=A0ABT7A313_9ACTN|nr:response regulator transcription factor [Streptomyces iconiensis]MDJ1135251.1 response regulator transcription factor [Streptomyces iconiensis]